MVMITAWRLVTTKYQNEAFTGEGSFKNGNRWNSPGRRVVYVAESQALAALENIVHFKKGQTPPAYAFFQVEFDPKFVQVLGTPLPSNWDTSPLVTAAIGDNWYDSGSSCILAVPTAVVPQGTNYLINVVHPDFAKVKVGTIVPFTFDRRIRDLVTPPRAKPQP